VVFSTAWIGAVAAFLVLAVTGRGNADELTVRACYAARGITASTLPSRVIWGRYALLGFAGLAILFIVIHLGGGGMHGH
jgi:hypothetical protein